VDVVFGSDLARTGAEGEGRRRRIRQIHSVLAEVELREQREPGIVAYSSAGLERVVAMGPGEVVNEFIALVQTTLRTAEVGPGDSTGRGMDGPGDRGFVRRAGQGAYKSKPSFVHQRGSKRGDDSRINRAHVGNVGGEIVRCNVVA